MPPLASDLETGKLVRWLKQPGDMVSEGDIIAVVDSAAGPTDVFASHDGVLIQHLVQENTRIPVGTPLARIDTGEPEHNAAPGDVSVFVASARLSVAELSHNAASALARSQKEIPHYHLGTRITLRRAGRWLDDFNSRRTSGEALPMSALFLKAVAVAVEDFPRFNGFHTGKGFEPSEDVHVGVSIAISGGITVAPAIHHSNRKSLVEISADHRELVQQARSGNLEKYQLEDPTITVACLGERGVASVHGLIFPPQVAMVGFGTPHLAPIARADGSIVTELIVDASLAGDHRVSGPHRGSRFLNRIASLLQNPEELCASRPPAKRSASGQIRGV